MSVFSRVEAFLRAFCPSSAPLLLALSGGPDSLCLFYCLLMYRNRYDLPFHIAHIDHGWRVESQKEAQILQQLASYHHVPFHLKTLDPTLLTGNLEAVCREERYAFFATTCRQIQAQGVLTGHHQNDQAETIFKRILEGSHWSRWLGLKLENWIQGVRVLRPLLAVPKKEIHQMLNQQGLEAFEDPTNHQVQFLRARLRETIFPWLNQKFGKEVQNSFLEIGEEVQELVSYFESRLIPLLDHTISGPWGFYLDLQTLLPINLLEIKYLLRLLCSKQGFFLSREIIQQAAKALQVGKANQYFVMGSRQIWIDRRRIFILPLSLAEHDSQIQNPCPGNYIVGNWKVSIEETLYSPSDAMTSWKEGWQGYLKHYVPVGSYTLGSIKKLEKKSIHFVAVKKRWNQFKVPAFLFVYFPLLWEEAGNYYEFLTGLPSSFLKEGSICWKFEANFIGKVDT